MARPCTPINISAIVAQYLAGHSMTKIAETNDTSRDIVRRVIRDHASDRTVLSFPISRSPIAPPGQVTSAELKDRAAITYKHLHYWTTAGYLRPVTEASPGQGNARLYPVEEVAVATLIRRFLGAGMNAQAGSEIARALVEHGHAMLAGIRLDLPT